MNVKKSVLLFLALLLPVCVFIFLKFFGKNEFDVPALYQEDAPLVPEGCNISYQVPYSVSPSVMNSLQQSGTKSIYLINFSNDKLVRILEAYGNDITTIEGSSLSTDVRQCALLMQPPHDLVVLDNNGKIRGYYNSTDREEIDRLLLELDILLKKY